MTYEEKVDRIKRLCEDYECECQLFDNPKYESALIGYTIKNDQVRAVYSEKGILNELQWQNNWNYHEAYDWYEYNVLGSLPDCIIIDLFPEEHKKDEEYYD